MPLRPPPPPTELTGFPRRRSSARVRTLYRIFWHRDRTGALNSPWRFSSLPSASEGRFDLPAPNGTCYWSSDRYGAFVEVFRGARTVEQSDLAHRRLATGSAPALVLAHLLAPRALPFGVTAAISTQPDYGLPQQWAASLHAAGFHGLVGTCSHDPSSAALNIAVFGPAGAPGAVSGWTTSAGPVLSDDALLRELAAFGVRIVPVPHTVPITTPVL